MYMKPCRNCPHREGCETKAEKLRALRGRGLSSVNFKCDKRLSLLPPGQRIGFEMGDSEIDDRDYGYTYFSGIVMRPSQRRPHRLLVWVTHREDEECESPLLSGKNPICLSPDRVTPIEGRVELCSECGQPEGTKPLPKREGVFEHFCPKCAGMTHSKYSDGSDCWTNPVTKEVAW